MRLCDLIQLFRQCGIGVPREKRLLANSHGIDAVFAADGKHLFQLGQNASGRNDRNVCMGIFQCSCHIPNVLYDHIPLFAPMHDFRDIFADMTGISAIGCNKFAAALNDIPHGIDRHPAGSDLNDSHE